MSAPTERGQQRSNNILLIGFRGCGKSSIGARLATRLDRSLFDTDTLVESRAGKTIREIFAEDGEPAFRTLEREAIESLQDDTDHVISVGGGAVLREDNRAQLRALGTCIWLSAPADELLRRTLADPRNAETRPPLTPLDAETEFRTLLAAREPLYAALADHVIDTSGHSLDEVVERIMTVLRIHETPDRP